MVSHRREPSPGALFALPLADGTWGVAQYLGRYQLVVFLCRSEKPVMPPDLAAVEPAFRTSTDATFYRSGRWLALGEAPIDGRHLVPRVCCEPVPRDPDQAYMQERTPDGLTERRIVPISQCRGAEPDGALPVTIELRLLRALECIPYDPWWRYLDTHPGIDWALPRPPFYRLEAEIYPDPYGIDAALAGRLRVPTAPPPTAPRGPMSPLEVDPAVGELFRGLHESRPARRGGVIESTLRDAARSADSPVTFGAACKAVAAAVLVAIATERHVDCGPFSEAVIRKYARDLGAVRGAALVPVAVAALEGALSSSSELTNRLAVAKDGAQLRSLVEALAQLLREPRHEPVASVVELPPSPASVLESHSQIGAFFRWLEEHESSEWPDLIARALGLAAKARGGLDVDQASHAVAAATIVALAAGKSVPLGVYDGEPLRSVVASIEGRVAKKLLPQAGKALAKATRPQSELVQLLRETGNYDGYRIRFQELTHALEE